MLKEAVADYSAVVSVKPDHVAWYQREVALFVHHHLDVPLSEFNIDVEMDKYFKESWCKRNHPAILSKYKQQPALSDSIQDVKSGDAPASPGAGISHVSSLAIFNLLFQQQK